jgi:acetyl-CoA C-acetyltransferase
MQFKEVYIVSTARTPIGSFGGSLQSFTAPQLGAFSIRGAMEKINLSPTEIDEVIMGNVLTANVGQAPARQAAVLAGLPYSVQCTTINKVCASGTKAIAMAAQSIMLGQSNIAISGGMESMSNVPYYIDKARFGYKLGNGNLIDGLIKDGLWDVYNDYHMGNAAENTAKEMNITREMQDEFAIQSYQKANMAIQQGKFKSEIVPIEITSPKGTVLVDTDEEPGKVNYEKLTALKPVFIKNGTVTAANASTLNDGAAALILASKEKVEELGLKPIAKIIGFADAEQSPEWFTTTPALAIPKALKQAKLTIEDVDYFEINEAFSVVSIANNQLLKLKAEKVNIYGGAVAMGHPIGCSGARIVVTLLNTLSQESGTIGVAGICNGGGGASALVVQKL